MKPKLQLCVERFRGLYVKINLSESLYVYRGCKMIKLIHLTNIEQRFKNKGVLTYHIMLFFFFFLIFLQGNIPYNIHGLM